MALPDFSAGAMENWGLTMYRESALLYKEGVSSSSDKEWVAIVIAHELAHQVQLFTIYLKNSFKKRLHETLCVQPVTHFYDTKCIHTFEFLIGIINSSSSLLEIQWFGNLVTMNWWNNLWLSEGFATYLSYLGVNDIEPTWNIVCFKHLKELLHIDILIHCNQFLIRWFHDDSTKPFVNFSYHTHI